MEHSRSKRIVTKARQRMSGRKLATIVVVALIHIGAIFGLLRAFDIDVVPSVVRSITTFSVPLDVQPEPPPKKVEEVEPEGASGEEAAKAKPKEITAPPARIPKKESPPVPPVSSTGDETRSGAAENGAGTGGGGPGIGTGSGGSGTGSGGVPFARHAEKVSGEIRAKDYPRTSAQDRNGAYVIVHFTVTPEGRATDCRVARSSGNPEVDRITCKLAVERFRYRPAIDGDGNPTSEKVGWKQWWWQ
ncbi:TonB family protein [Croceicoccus ponticola]|uniref:TonB family protein n=1 Tax=Croceicoccus ponticola TaxID=2217664 RepID=UPI00196B3351|nr:TonB family protein [Croceicoccus ponticola]